MKGGIGRERFIIDTVNVFWRHCGEGERFAGVGLEVATAGEVGDPLYRAHIDCVTAGVDEWGIHIHLVRQRDSSEATDALPFLFAVGKFKEFAIGVSRLLLAYCALGEGFHACLFPPSSFHVLVYTPVRVFIAQTELHFGVKFLVRNHYLELLTDLSKTLD